MPNVSDVARYILEQMEFTTAMKLQKLVYYSQAWSVVWDGEALFDDRIEAWIKARKGLLPNERGNNEITLARLEEYYSSL